MIEFECPTCRSKDIVPDLEMDDPTFKHEDDCLDVYYECLSCGAYITVEARIYKIEITD